MSVSSISSPSATDSTQATQGRRGHHQMPSEVVDALANKLGMSSDELKSKLSASDDPRKALDQLAEQKGISKQELRETILSAMPHRDGQANGAGGPPAGGPPKINFDDETGQKLLATLADKLGTTADDLKSKLDNGADLRDLLKQGGVSREDVHAAFEEAFKSWKSYGASGSGSNAAPPEPSAVDIQV